MKAEIFALRAMEWQSLRPGGWGYNPWRKCRWHKPSIVERTEALLKRLSRDRPIWPHDVWKAARRMVFKLSYRAAPLAFLSQRLGLESYPLEWACQELNCEFFRGRWYASGYGATELWGLSEVMYHRGAASQMPELEPECSACGCATKRIYDLHSFKHIRGAFRFYELNRALRLRVLDELGFRRERLGFCTPCVRLVSGRASGLIHQYEIESGLDQAWRLHLQIKKALKEGDHEKRL